MYEKPEDYHKLLKYFSLENVWKIVVLLVPVYVDEENGYRYYAAGQMAQLHRIIALKNMEFSIDDIRKILTVHYRKAARISQ